MIRKVTKSRLTPLRQTRRRRNIWYGRRWQQLCLSQQIMRSQEILHHRRPSRDVVVITMAVISVRRRHHQLIRPSACSKRLIKLMRHLRGKPVVVLRVNPEHRYSRLLSEVLKRRHEPSKIAVVLFAIAAPTSRKADRRFQPCRRIRRQRHLRKPSRRHTRTYNRACIHLWQLLLRILRCRPQVIRTIFSRFDEASLAVILTTSELSVLIPKRPPISLTHHDQHNVTAPCKPDRLR